MTPLKDETSGSSCLHKGALPFGHAARLNRASFLKDGGEASTLWAHLVPSAIGRKLPWERPVTHAAPLSLLRTALQGQRGTVDFAWVERLLSMMLADGSRKN